jgi:hypothetical protein
MSAKPRKRAKRARALAPPAQTAPRSGGRSALGRYHECMAHLHRRDRPPAPLARAGLTIGIVAAEAATASSPAPGTAPDAGRRDGLCGPVVALRRRSSGAPQIAGGRTLRPPGGVAVPVHASLAVIPDTSREAIARQRAAFTPGRRWWSRPSGCRILGVMRLLQWHKPETRCLSSATRSGRAGVHRLIALGGRVDVIGARHCAPSCRGRSTKQAAISSSRAPSFDPEQIVAASNRQRPRAHVSHRSIAPGSRAVGA